MTSFQNKCNQTKLSYSNIPNFNGTSDIDWDSFQNAFNKHVLYLLKSRLEGEALSLIQDEDNIAMAWKILSEKYYSYTTSDFYIINASNLVCFPSSVKRTITSGPVFAYSTTSEGLGDIDIQNDILPRNGLANKEVDTKKKKVNKKKNKQKKKRIRKKNQNNTRPIDIGASKTESEEEISESDYPEFSGNYRRDWKKFQDKYMLDFELVDDLFPSKKYSNSANDGKFKIIDESQKQPMDLEANNNEKFIKDILRLVSHLVNTRNTRDICNIPQLSEEYPSNWKEFQKKFTESTGKYNDNKKFELLKNILPKNARNRIKHLSPPMENRFTIAWNILSKVYGRQYEKDCHIHNLFTVKPLTSSGHLEDLKEFYNTINKHVNGLLALNVDVLNWRELLPCIVSRLDDVTRNKWVIENRCRRAPRFTTLLHFLGTLIINLENKNKRKVAG